MLLTEGAVATENQIVTPQEAQPDDLRVVHTEEYMKSLTVKNLKI